MRASHSAYYDESGPRYRYRSEGSVYVGGATFVLTQTSGLWKALEVARGYMQGTLGDASSEHAAYCRALVGWVLTGQGERRGGRPNREVRKLVAEAVTVGLTEAFGVSYREWVDASVFRRCDAL